MFDQDVTTTFNADMSGYSASLHQAIALSNQYADSADTMLGSLGKLNIASSLLIKSFAGLTQSNKMATSQAAAYQQMLEGVSATALAAGQSITGVQNATLKLARSYPIGMGQAVAQTKQLQQSGVVTAKAIQQLGVEFTKLGAATGTYGPALGDSFLQLTRTMGNSINQVGKLGDSLTSVTAKYGASAASVVQFSKAIAPVASIAGMTQTQVMGISTAFSRLGDDGYRAANAFNKIVLDMTRSITYGTPEVKSYASALNMTTDQMTRLFKTDPSAFIVKFTNTINTQGVKSIKTLDQLGFDGLNTFKAIQTLAKSGDLQAVINTSVSSFGNGSTNKAAGEAMGGVNDKLSKLQENMSQTVAATGKPFLGYMGSVLDVANSLSEAVNKIATSPLAQTLQTWGAGFKFVATAAMHLVTAMTLIGMGRGIGMKIGASGMAANFMSGFRNPELARSGGMVSGMGGIAAMPLMAYRNAGGGPGVFRMGGRMAMNTSSMLMMANANMINGGWGKGSVVGAQRMRAAEDVAHYQQTGMWPVRQTAANPVLTPYAPGMAPAEGEIIGGQKVTKWQAAELRLRQQGVVAKEGFMGEHSVRNFGRAFAYQGAATGMAGARIAGSGLKGIGMAAGMLTGLPLPAVGAVAGIGAAAYVGDKLYRDAQQKAADIRSIATAQTVNTAFNNFAEKAGTATRSLTSFSTIVTESTMKLANQSTTWSQAGKLSAAQLSSAKQPSYKASYTTPKGVYGSTDVATWMGLMLGPNPTAPEVSKVGQDIAARTGQGPDVAQAALAKLTGQGTGYRGVDLGSMSGTIGRLEGNQGLSTKFYKQVGEYGRNAQAQAQQTYGDKASSGVGFSQGAQLLKSIVAAERAGKLGINSRKQGLAQVAAFMGLDKTGQQQLQDAYQESRANLVVGQESKYNFSLGNVRSGLSGTSRSTFDANKGYTSQGGYAANPASFAELTSDAKTAMSTVVNFANVFGKQGAKVSNAMGAIASEMYGQDRMAVLNGSGYVPGARSFSQTGSASQQRGAGIYSQNQKYGFDAKISKYVEELMLHPDNAGAAYGASTSQAKQLYKAAPTGGTNGAIAMLLNQTPQSSPLYGVLQQAASTTQAVQSTNLTALPTQQWKSAISAWHGDTQQLAKNPAMSDQGALALFGADKQAQQQALQSYLGFAQQWLAAEDQTHVALERANEGYHINVKRSTDAFNRNQLVNQQAFNRSLQRQAKAAALALAEPYTRMQAGFVSDASGAIQNVNDKSKTYMNQLDQVKQLKKMGLTQNAVDQFSLGTQGNWQQTSQVFNDLSQNKNFIAQMNKAAQAALAAGHAAVADKSNVAVQQATQDYKISVANQRKEFNIGLGNMRQDLGLQQRYALQDLARAGTEYGNSAADINKKFIAKISDLPGYAKAKMGPNIIGLVKDMKASFKSAWADQFRGLPNPLDGGSSTTGAVDANGVATAWKSIAGARVDSVGTHSITIHKNGTIMTITGLSTIPAGITKDSVINVGEVLGTSTKSALKVSVKHTATSQPASTYAPPTALGGVTMMPQIRTVGEADPEAIIPLNRRGTSVIAAAMKDYMTFNDLKSNQTAGHSIVVHNTYNYDHSTAINGPISVVSQDPMDMMKKMQAKKQLTALTSKRGAMSSGG